MKKEIKEILFVVIVGFCLTLGLVLSSIFVNHNTFKSGKRVTLRISYLNRSYEYENIKSESVNLYELLSEYNDKLALSFLPGIGDSTALYSIKSTDISAFKHYTYLIKLNDEYLGDDLSGIPILDDCVITIDYISKDESTNELIKLAPGGDEKLTYYFKVSVTLYTTAAIIAVPLVLYVILALLKYKRQMQELAHINQKSA